MWSRYLATVLFGVCCFGLLTACGNSESVDRTLKASWSGVSAVDFIKTAESTTRRFKFRTRAAKIGTPLHLNIIGWEGVFYHVESGTATLQYSCSQEPLTTEKSDLLDFKLVKSDDSIAFDFDSHALSTPCHASMRVLVINLQNRHGTTVVDLTVELE